MKFELLPNEIIIECFEYLNIIEIIYSFNNLNEYFNQLIQTIPLHFNFKSIKKSIFDKICQFLLTNPEVKQQIYSLTLSNKNTCGQIDAFISLFSLEQFTRLHSLTLIQVDKKNISKLKFMLPLIPQLSSFHLLDSNNIILACPFVSNLQILSIPTLQSIQTSFSSVTHLTISLCSFDQLLYRVFEYVPMLNYLKIPYISKYDDPTMSYSNVVAYKAVHLKELILGNFEYNFQNFEEFVKYIPNITSLELYGNYDIDMIDANRWENLITSSLRYLNTFKFLFSYIYRTSDDNILEKLNQFQNDFWCKQHQWYTEYSLSEYLAFIYTIPYTFTTFKLELDTKRYWNQQLNTFDKVKNLTLYHATLKESCEYYFPNVSSLTLLPSEEYYKPNLGGQAMKTLKTIINLSNLIHISFSVKFRIKNSSLLIRILNETPQLSSLSISIRALEQFSYDPECCDCLNKRIKKLDIYKYGSPSFKCPYNLVTFCKIFSNLEQLVCNIDQANDLLYLVENLPKLSIFKGYLWKMKDYGYFQTWFKNQTRKLNLLFRMNYIDKHETELFIWINRSIN